MHSQFRIAVASCSLPCAHSHLVTHARLASTSAASSTSPRYPFPAHRNPTPHQIFHLSPGASQADIKARCTSFRPCTPSPADRCTTDYELARTFHPDSPAAQALPATVRHARFHAVTRAYDILRGKPHSLTADDDAGAELARRRRQRQVYRQRAAADFAEAAGVGGADEAWKDQVIIVFGLAVRALSSSLYFMRPSDADSLVGPSGGLRACTAVVARDSRCAASRCVRELGTGSSRCTDIWRRATRCYSCARSRARARAG
jgi:hypothetical protein